MSSATLPAGLDRLSRVPRRLLSWGVPMGPLVLLRTRGRTSGLPRTVPVVTLRHDNVDWLVSPFGATHWVRNLRADPYAELGRGHRFHMVRLVEIDDDDKRDILHRYRRKFGIVPFVRHAFDAAPGDSPSAFRAEANRHPTFLVRPDS